MQAPSSHERGGRTIGAIRDNDAMTVMQPRAGLPTVILDTDAVSMLAADHARVDRLLDEFASTRAMLDESEKDAVVAEICFFVTMHSMLEKEIFYPAVRDSLGGDGADLLDEAEVEHAGVKRLVAELSTMTVRDALYDAKVLVLGEYVRHHVQQEETRLFPRIRASGLDLDSLAERMRTRQQLFETDIVAGATS
jgi:hemerythrin superfamily protein